MDSATQTSSKDSDITKLAPQPPAWVFDLLGSGASRKSLAHGKTISFDEVSSVDFGLLTVRVVDAKKLNATAMSEAAGEAYDLIARHLKDQPWNNPVRFWNHLPDIHAPMGEVGDRYMAFNVGRYAAFVRWYGESHFDECVATASGVGHEQNDLLIHCLAAATIGAAVGNPRQIPPYLYSRRFGRVPPCFARATVIPADESRTASMLVGGTASVRGEDSVHRGDLHRQMLETFENLATILRSHMPQAKRPLDHYRELRVYIVRAEDEKEIRSMIAEAMPKLRRIEMTPADLCRRELLVEIEGIAEV